jgi:hypothetical protein
VVQNGAESEAAVTECLPRNRNERGPILLASRPGLTFDSRKLAKGPGPMRWRTERNHSTISHHPLFLLNRSAPASECQIVKGSGKKARPTPSMTEARSRRSLMPALSPGDPVEMILFVVRVAVCSRISLIPEFLRRNKYSATDCVSRDSRCSVPPSADRAVKPRDTSGDGHLDARAATDCRSSLGRKPLVIVIKKGDP